MKNTILSILFLGLGFGLGQFFSKKTTPDNNVLPEAVRFNFENLANKELKNYALLQDAEAKLKAADELYAKMVVLFLADLSLKVELPIQASQTLWKDHPKPMDPTTKAAQEISPLGSFKQMTSDMKESLEEKSDSVGVEEDKAITKGLGQAVRHYKLSDYVTKMTPQIKRMMGVFKGVIEIEAGKDKGQKHQIRMNLDMTQKDDKLDGISHIELRDAKGVVYSESNGDGGNSSLKQSAERPKVIFLDVSPDRFISLDISTFPRLEGHFFEKNVYRGSVKLRKEN